MKFALVNGDRVEARQGMKGACVYCQSDMVAKCGQVRFKHWAHKSKVSCDPWWENETEWHREWKNKFPAKWQEIKHIDPTTGDTHIADIKTDRGFVIEFQHSAIPSDEIQSREDFYKNMVWVVDGTRSPMDYKRFCKGSSDFTPGGKYADSRSSFWEGVFMTFFPEECFPKRWLSSSVPVYFDFQGINSLDQPDENRSFIWGLLPGEAGGRSVVVKLRREKFIECSIADPHLLLAQYICSRMAEERAQEEQRREDQKWREKQRAEAFRQWWINPRRGR